MTSPSGKEKKPLTGNAELLAEEELGFFVELWEFMRVRKRFWLAPVIFALVLLGLLFYFAGTHATVAPFLYAL